MSDSSGDPDIAELLGDLTQGLRRLQREAESSRDRPLRQDLARFTSEVAIPGLILLLKTNIQALELLRRAIRIAEGRELRQERTSPEMRDRVERLGQVTLARLDDVLTEMEDAVEGRPADDRSVELIQEARNIRQQIQEELGADGEDADEVDIDVEAELRSLKDDIDDATGDSTNGTDDGTDPDEPGTGDR
jgi:hypothetical protein